MKRFFRKHWPLVGIALLILTVGFYLGRARKEIVRKPVLADVASGEAVKLADIHFTQHTPGGGMKWTLDAREVTISLDRQRFSFNDFRLKLEPQNRPSVELEGKRGDYDKASGEIKVRGDLRGQTENGYTIMTDQAVFKQKEGLLETDEPVRITGPSLSVEGTGLRYRVETEDLNIHSDVTTRIDVRSLI
jgi:LPS export ABC transporter protein LptC